MLEQVNDLLAPYSGNKIVQNMKGGSAKRENREATEKDATVAQI